MDRQKLLDSSHLLELMTVVLKFMKNDKKLENRFYTWILRGSDNGEVFEVQVKNIVLIIHFSNKYRN